jgi:hypothetical protein
VGGRFELLELPSRHGFGHAVRAALERVSTPLVCVVQHDRTMMRADLKHMVCESFDFAFSGGVFSEADDTDAVFGAAVEPRVAATAAGGGVMTLMCFGQTGSGKTYTTNGLAERAATAIFASLPTGATVGTVCAALAKNAPRTSERAPEDAAVRRVAATRAPGHSAKPPPVSKKMPPAPDARPDAPVRRCPMALFRARPVLYAAAASPFFADSAAAASPMALSGVYAASLRAVPPSSQ